MSKVYVNKETNEELSILGMYDLECRFDSRQSFYKKAKVKIKEDNITYDELLYSYGTLVAIYTKDKMSDLEIFTYNGKYSQTTTRHQKEFFKQKGLVDKEIKELFNKGVLEKRCINGKR